MLNFIATNIFMLSFGGLLYMTARALPRIGEEEKQKKGFFERVMKSGMPEQLDEASKAFTVKFLRKSKVYLLKLENTVTKKLRNMSPDSSAPFAVKTGGEDSKVDFKEILEEKAEREGEV